jgi:hypothetical protein
MAEEAVLVVSIKRVRGGFSAMRREPALAALAGLMLAVALVAGVALAGGWSARIDLVRASTPGQTTDGYPTTSGGTAVSPPTTLTNQASSSSTGSGGPSLFSLNGLASRGAPGLGELILPIVLGAVLGIVFFGAYTRRLERE